jgi:hypothetical protein
MRFLTITFAAIVFFAGRYGSAEQRRYLYVAEPGIRNYLQYGGTGVLVFDIDNGYRFVKRIPIWVNPGRQLYIRSDS